MKNLAFAATVCAVVSVSLGAVALRYHLQDPLVLQPVTVVYHDDALLPGQDQRSSDRYWTLAVRSDGSSMQTNGVPNAIDHIGTVKSVEFKDRYVVVDPATMSISTYKPYRPIFVANRDCSGSSTASILGHPMEYVRSEKPDNAKSGFRMVTERWLAVDLNCTILREHLTETDKDGKVTQLYREAVSVKPGEPPTDFFDIPANYQERGPAEVNNELETNGRGKVFCNKDSADKLQKVYESDKKLK